MAYPRAFYEEVYGVLVEEGHVRADLGMMGAFVDYFTGSDAVLEWRFQGKLGFGGKLWHTRHGHNVTCYPEDRTKKRLAMIKSLNARIAALEEKWGRSSTG